MTSALQPNDGGSRSRLALGVAATLFLVLVVTAVALGDSWWHWTTSEPHGPGVQRLVDAQVVDAGERFPLQAPAANAPAIHRQLPDNWNGTRPGKGGYVWYQLSFERDADRVAADTVYMPAVSMNAQLWVNGVDLGSLGRMTEPVARHLLTPLLWHLPPQILKPGANELRVLVVGYPHLRSGLAEVYAGPRDPLARAHSHRLLWQKSGTIVTVVLSVLIGAYALLLWWLDRGQSLAGIFGAAALIWGLRNLNLVVTEPWGHGYIDNLFWSRLAAVGAPVFIGLLGLATIRYRQLEEPHWQPPAWQRSALWAYMVITGVALLVTDDPDRARAVVAVGAVIGILLTIATQIRLLGLALRRPTTERVLLALSGALYALLLCIDARIIVDTQSQGQVFLRQYAALPLFLGVGWAITRRYIRALKTARSSAERLQTEVDRQAAEMRRQFDALRTAERQAERDHATAAERERLMRDLHDGLGLHLNAALRLAQAGAATRPVLEATLRDALDDLRITVDSLSDDERNPAAVLGTLRYRLAPRLVASGIELAWRVVGDIPELPWLDTAHALHLLRLAQEAINNAVQHSGGTVVQVSLVREASGVRVTVSDDGRTAFSGSSVQAGTHRGRGVANMQARAAALGGELRIHSSSTSHEVSWWLPMERAAVA